MKSSGIAKNAVLHASQSSSRFFGFVFQASSFILPQTSSMMFMSSDWAGQSLSTLIFFAWRNFVVEMDVGWKTTREYYTWISAQTNVDNTVLFKAYYLPSDDDDYYQFCYVNHNGDVRGASIPFQFSYNPEDEDILMNIVEKLTEENAVLQGQLSSLEVENRTQAGKIQNLQDDLLSATEKVERLEKENMELTIHAKNHEGEIDTMNKTIQSLNIELQMQRSQEEKLLSDFKEMEKTMERIKEDKKHSENLQIDIKIAEEEKLKLETELKLYVYAEYEAFYHFSHVCQRYEEKEKTSLAEREELKQALERSEAEKHHLQSEDLAKQKVLENMTCTANQCKEENVKLKAELENKTGANIFCSALQFAHIIIAVPSMSLECGRKPENPEETHANPGRTYKILAHVVQGYIGGLSTALQNGVDKPLMAVGLAYRRKMNEFNKVLDLERSLVQKDEDLRSAEETMAGLSKQVDFLERCALHSSCSGCERRSAGKQSSDVTALLSGCPALTARPEKQSAEDRQRKGENGNKKKQIETLQSTVAKLEGEVKEMKNARKMQAEKTETELRAQLACSEDKILGLELQLAEQQVKTH
ncbi:unnamed protein product [Ranitomeya imitator]|uniref:SKICH domain-containing protein n=1 Tax=Ranitomeya imitator TaxID=111125 RepID=A0ABN9LF34_9NEOB|nr:unnamed protein product [Ranitomeya imitator]